MNSKPKIAICLSGQSQNVDSRGIQIDYTNSLDSFKNNILNSADVDIFIHTWSSKKDTPSLQSRLISDYSPTKIILEEPIFPNYNIPNIQKPPTWAQQYDFKTKLQVLSSRWDSQKKVNDLRIFHQKANKISYDFIMCSRFDMIYYEPFPWDLMNPGNYYFTNWHANWSSDGVPGYNDPYFISNNYLTNIYSSIFDDLHKNWATNSSFENYICKELKRKIEDKFSAHTIIRWKFLNEGYINKERFIGIEHKTWNLNRKSHIMKNPWWTCPWNTQIPFDPNSVQGYNQRTGKTND